ncbi:hypothetical protein DFH09DRAFT_1334055 [Mycena vulgaris]|nr:hypothetical protein DFH09DRAFT_1334055 [Mycena vulgaris]
MWDNAIWELEAEVETLKRQCDEACTVILETQLAAAGQENKLRLEAAEARRQHDKSRWELELQLTAAATTATENTITIENLRSEVARLKTKLQNQQDRRRSTFKSQGAAIPARAPIRRPSTVLTRTPIVSQRKPEKQVREVNEMKRKVSAKILEGLNDILGERTPKVSRMEYTAYKEKIQLTFRVQLVGWPEGIPFQSVTRLNLEDLKEFQSALDSGSCKWVALTDGELAKLVKEIEARNVVKNGKRKREMADDDDDDEEEQEVHEVKHRFSPHKILV